MESGDSCPKSPPDFIQWLDKQLGETRKLGIKLDVFLITFADSWPSPWHRTIVYFDPIIARPTTMEAYRVNVIYVDPPVMTVITAGVGAMKQLKKTLTVHLSTTATPTLAQHANLAPELVDWRPFLIPSFVASKRLLIDFSPSDLVEVVGAFAQVALRAGGLRSRHTSRSFGDCAEFKRRTLVISYPPNNDTDDETLVAYHCGSDQPARVPGHGRL